MHLSVEPAAAPAVVPGQLMPELAVGQPVVVGLSVVELVVVPEVPVVAVAVEVVESVACECTAFELG